MKIVAISDPHGDLPSKLPSGDVLVIAGDILPEDFHPNDRDTTGTTRVMRQMWWHDEKFVPWLNATRMQFENVIFIGGNHDFAYDKIGAEAAIREDLPEGIHYLNESDVTIDGVKFYGAPWNMTQGWAFAIDERGYALKLGAMPTDVDVLITHGPPAIDDMPGVHYTSEILADWLALTPMKAVICGHIHEAYGEYKIGDTPIYVVSIKDRKYDSVQPPTEIEI